jgi:hypothetical protein
MADNRTSTIVGWLAWMALSPFLLYALIQTPVGIGLLFLMAVGGGPLVASLGITIFAGLIGGLIGKGVCVCDGFVKGFVFVVLPVIELVLGASIYRSHFSDESFIKNAEKKASAIFITQPMIPITGLYTESIPLKSALYGMLIERRFSFIEGDVAGSQWLFDMAKDPQALAEKAKDNQYFRLSFGSNDSQDCLSWKDESKRLDKGVPVRPGTCLRVIFDNHLLADTRLRVNLDRVNRHEIRWEITRIQETGPIISIPFWFKRSDKPILLDVYNYVLYTDKHNYSSFARLIRKLAPETLNLNSDGRPYVLSIFPGDRSVFSRHHLPLNPPVTVRQAGDTWIDRKKETWEEGLRRAETLNQPTIINDVIVILPKSEEIIYNFTNEIGGTVSLATECCVFVLRRFTPNIVHGIKIAIWSYGGDSRNIIIKPDSLPADVSFCVRVKDCNFRADDFKITDTDIVVVGRYSNVKGKTVIHSEKYELVVSRSQLPPEWFY